MNRVQFFINKLVQECSELTKDSTKLSMFGVNSYDPNDPLKKPNVQLVVEEYLDVISSFELLIEELGVADAIELLSNKEAQRQYINFKKLKTLKYLEICKEIGSTFDNPVEG